MSVLGFEMVLVRARGDGGLVGDAVGDAGGEGGVAEDLGGGDSGLV